MSELDEVRHLITQATYPKVRKLLSDYEKTLIQTEASVPPEVPQTNGQTENASSVPSKVPDVPPVSSRPVPVPVPTSSSGVVYTPIADFAWDQGGYNSPTVTVYVELEGVGEVKDSVDCKFTKSSFDLTVHGLNGKHYRLIKDNLDKDIVPEKSKILVKKNKIVVKLQKVKGEYSYEHWAHLTAKKPREQRDSKKDPSASIMDMMKDM